MAFMVVCAGGMTFTPDHRLFECRDVTWKEIRELALRYGWMPEGPTPDPIWGELWKKCGFDPSYECDDYGKMVSDSDAAGLADAIERALADSETNWAALSASPRPALVGDAFDGERLMRANRGVDPALLGEFVRFLRKGWFSFCWDD